MKFLFEVKGVGKFKSFGFYLFIDKLTHLRFFFKFKLYCLHYLDSTYHNSLHFNISAY